MEDLLEKMPDTTAFSDLPNLQVNYSAPLGGRDPGPTLKKQVSRGAIAAEKKRLAAKRAN